MENEKRMNKNFKRSTGWRRVTEKTFVILFWLAVWYALALCVDNPVLLVTPDSVFVRLVALTKTAAFWKTVIASLLRISAGFVMGVFVAFLCAALAYRCRMAEEILRPFIQLIKAIPVVSFVVLFLVWWGSSVLGAAISFLVVLPNVYINVLEGLKNTDRELLEMAEVFKVTKWNRFFYIHRPALRPFVESAFRLSIGMSWKSGVAAEVIGTPAYSVGGQIYFSKIYLDTEGVLAWTAVTILASLLMERLLLWLLPYSFEPARRKRTDEKEPGGKKEDKKRTTKNRQDKKRHNKKNQDKRRQDKRRQDKRKQENKSPDGKVPAGKIVLSGVNKSFGEKKVLVNVSTTYEPGKTYYLTSPSGSGKTTLLRILAGLEAVDSGSVSCPRCSMVFQEDRLCEEYSALQNVVLATGNTGRAKEAISFLLGEENVHEACSRLSGGMKRRVALVRAMEAASEVVLLDEPFTGMDAETRQRAETYIRVRQCGRTLIIATHI